MLIGLKNRDFFIKQKKKKHIIFLIFYSRNHYIFWTLIS